MKKSSHKTNHAQVKGSMKVTSVNHNKTRDEMEKLRGENDKLKFEDSPWL